LRSYWFIVGVLGVWRLTHLLQTEDGPWNLVVRLRHAAGKGFPSQLMDCFNCLSLWIAAPFACLLGEGLPERLLRWPAISGGAILLQRATEKEPEAPSIYFEGEGVEHALLRRSETQCPAAETQHQAPAA
jgi:hypothetical protein